MSATRKASPAVVSRGSGKTATTSAPAIGSRMSAVVSMGQRTATNTTTRTQTANAIATAYVRRRPDWTRATSPPTWIVPDPISSSERSITGSSTLRRSATESATAGRRRARRRARRSRACAPARARRGVRDELASDGTPAARIPPTSPARRRSRSSRSPRRRSDRRATRPFRRSSGERLPDAGMTTSPPIVASTVRIPTGTSIEAALAVPLVRVLGRELAARRKTVK